MIPGLGRSPGEGKGYPFQFSRLENSMDYKVHGVAESDTTEWFSFHFHFHSFTHCSSFRHVCHALCSIILKNKSLIISENTEYMLLLSSLSYAQLFATPWTTTHQVSLSSTLSQSLLKFMSIESVMLSNHLIFCSLFSFCLQSCPESGSFPVSWLFATGDKTIRVLHQSFQ